MQANIGIQSDSKTPLFTQCNDAASASCGGRILFATDDFFGAAENLLNDTEPISNNEYTEFGKWMDGWETRRRREAGHDWCIIKLSGTTIIKGFEVNTAFFTGNYAPRISIQAIQLSPGVDAMVPVRKPFVIGVKASKKDIEKCELLRSEEWPIIVPMMKLNPGFESTRKTFISNESNEEGYTHIRLNLYPDGGVARLRVYGETELLPGPSNYGVIMDMMSMRNGGKCLCFSNAHYGHPKNLIKPGRGVNMGDGWETARRLDRPAVVECDADGIKNVPGIEWAVFKLGACTDILSVEVDTNHFKGNSPDSVRIDGTEERAESLANSVHEAEWIPILGKQKLNPHAQHTYKKELLSHGPYNCVRIQIAPDGGIARVRILGKIHTGI